MKFKEGTHIYTKDGEDVGEIDRVVLDPRTNEVTHVVVRQGFLFTEDKVVPIEWIDAAEEEVVTLREDIEDLDALPVFEQERYVVANSEVEDIWPATGATPPVYSHPAPGTAWWQYPGYPGFVGPYIGDPAVRRTVRAVPADEVALKEGADVITRDGEHAGTIDEVLLDDETERATHFVIEQGLVSKERKLIPTAWVDKMHEGKVRLLVGSELLEDLKAFSE